MHNKTNKSRGFSLVEIAVVLGIIGVLAAVFLTTLQGSRTTDTINSAVQQIYDDLITIRSKSVSTNKNHRINFLSTSTWRIEVYNEASSTWDVESGVKTMAADTYLTDTSFANAGANLSATPRGLFVFGGSSIGTPYVTVTGLGATNTRSLYVHVGGAIDKQTP